MAFLDKKITELAFVSTPGQNDRIAIVNLGVTKQTSVSKFLQSVVAATGSFLNNASITGNQITFTRADSSTFTLTIASASFADTSISSSYALSSSAALRAVSSSFAEFATSASYALSASNAISASYAITSSHAITSSYSLEALSASFADFATSASYAVTASHALNVPETASYAITSSFSLRALSASFADFVESASYAVTASHALNVPESASYAVTASYSLESLSASFAAFATSASYAVTASHALNVPDTASFAVTSSYAESSSLAQRSISSSRADSALSASFADRATSASNADTASRVEENLTNGLGIDAFTYNGSVADQVQLDTSSAHFTTGVSASQATILTTLSASFSTSQTNLSSSASTARISLSASAATALNNVSSSAATDIVANSASIAALSGSAAAERLNYVETSSIIGGGNIIQFTKGGGAQYLNTIITSSFVKSVNGINPNPTTGNVAVAIGSVETGLSSSIPASADDADIWIVSGETGSNTGSNGKAFIYSTASSQWFEISNLDQAENDVRYVNTTGDTMTGLLVLSGDPTLPLHAATRQYVDRAYISSSIDGTTLSLFTGTTPATEHSHSITNAISSSYAVTASYAISASHEIRKETTSSVADTASFVTGSGVYGPYGSNSIISSSHALTASFITASNIYGPHFTSSVVSSSYAITASHILGLIDTVRADFTSQTTFAALHNLNTEDIVVQVYQDDASTGNLPVQIVPDSITLTNLNTATVTFAVATTGYVVISRGGFNRSGSIQDAVSASIANTVQNPLNQGLGVETFSYDGGTSGVIVQVDTSSAHFLSSSVATASFASTASYVNSTYRENVAGDVRYTITHNLNEQYPVVQTYDTTTNRQLIPDFIESTGVNTLNIEYAVTFSGIVVVQK